MILPVKGYRKFLGGGRNWIILAFSLLLAFFMWSIMKLSANYSSYIRYQLEVTTNIPGRSNLSKSTDVLVIGAKSTGFNILQNTNGNNNATTLFLEDIDSKHFHKYGENGDMFYLLPDNIHQKIQDALGTDIKVESVATDTLFFKFALQSNKKVPVVPNSMVTFAKQYMPYSPIVLKPDSVLVYGEADVISKISQVATDAIKIKNASGSITGVIDLAPLQGVRYSAEEVLYSQEIGRYVENTLKVPVTIANAPSYANIAIIPQEVTVKYRQPFANSATYLPQDFSVSVEYDEILRKDVIKPIISRMPEGILEISVEPKFVECVL